MATSNVQIDKYLRSCPWYVGSYASDAMPDPATLKPGSGLIVNTNAQGDDGVGHWIGILTPEPSRGKELLYFDAYGFQPDDTNPIMRVTTHFGAWCKRASELAGQGGTYRTSDIEIECTLSTVCGELSAWFIKHRVLPARPDGSIVPVWQPIVRTMRDSGCKMGDRLIRTLVPM